VEFSGLRPGEKLDERLVYPYEEAVATSHPLVKRVCATPGASMNGHGDDFEHGLYDLIRLAGDHGDSRAILSALMQCVPEYAPLDQLTIEKPGVLG
jgi:FlaA1/EpsC-like NDP-sugar epimerase